MRSEKFDYDEDDDYENDDDDDDDDNNNNNNNSRSSLLWPQKLLVVCLKIFWPTMLLSHLANLLQFFRLRIQNSRDVAVQLLAYVFRILDPSGRAV